MVIYDGKEIDPWNFLNIPKNTDLQTLKKIYKTISKQYHPDINNTGSCNDFFIIAILSINEIKDHIKKKNNSNPEHKLKESYFKYTKSTKNSLSSVKKFVKNGSFDTNKFNSFFDDYKIDDSNQSGYSEKDFIKEETINEKVTNNNFNDVFDKNKKKNISKSNLLAKNTTHEIYANTNLESSQLDDEKISDYSNTSGKLNYTDFKLAYNGYNYIDSNKEFEKKKINLKSFKENRSNTNFEMSKTEKKLYADEISKKHIYEKQRIARIKERDNYISEKYSELQGKLLS